MFSTLSIFQWDCGGDGWVLPDVKIFIFVSSIVVSGVEVKIEEHWHWHTGTGEKRDHLVSSESRGMKWNLPWHSGLGRRLETHKICNLTRPRPQLRSLSSSKWDGVSAWSSTCLYEGLQCNQSPATAGFYPNLAGFSPWLWQGLR